MKMITCLFIIAVDVSFPLVEKDLSIPEPPTVVSAARAAHRSKRGFGSITIAGQTSKILQASLLLLLSFHFHCPFLPPALHFPPTVHFPLIFIPIHVFRLGIARSQITPNLKSVFLTCATNLNSFYEMMLEITVVLM